MQTFAQNLWTNQKERGIEWIPTQLAHQDHIEMSGKKIAAVIRYGVNELGQFSLNRSVIWPMLRTIPNNTHASLMNRFSLDVADMITVNGLNIEQDQVCAIHINGYLGIRKSYRVGVKNIGAAKQKINAPIIEMEQLIYPSTTLPVLCEKYIIHNISDKPVVLSVPEVDIHNFSEASKGVSGAYRFQTSTSGTGTVQLQPDERYTFYLGIQANEKSSSQVVIDFEKEWLARTQLVAQISEHLSLSTPDEDINQMFRFAKVRAAESIYATQQGLMHGPGGESYYAAIWANDQAEYINPLSPFLGYPTIDSSAINSFRHFARFMNDNHQPIPSSIVAEGLDIWNGAGDRGDAAMIAYGASRYALARSDKKEATELWGLISWCLDYCQYKLNEQGVVSSDTDELEGRFPAGTANLSTSTLYYDALLSAVFLGQELGKDKKQLQLYKNKAAALKLAIEKYFGHEVSGFDTYQYYEGNDVLRSWICMPLTVDIFDRKEQTIAALLSPKLFTKNGLLTQENSETFWDRSTLYALRGIFRAGAIEEGIKYLKYYSSTRLLGDHVPYAIEAWPEGGQRHLAAESGLYCRIITEGLFGMRPTGFKSFDLTINMPQDWEHMTLENIGAFGGQISIEVKRGKANQLVIKVKKGNQVLRFTKSNHQKISVKLS